jgi:hypothetical protein
LLSLIFSSGKSTADMMASLSCRIGGGAGITNRAAHKDELAVLVNVCKNFVIPLDFFDDSSALTSEIVDSEREISKSESSLLESSLSKAQGLLESSLSTVSGVLESLSGTVVVL